jgi:hypothetical protein
MPKEKVTRSLRLAAIHKIHDGSSHHKPRCGTKQDRRPDRPLAAQLLFCETNNLQLLAMTVTANDDEVKLIHSAAKKSLRILKHEALLKYLLTFLFIRPSVVRTSRISLHGLALFQCCRRNSFKYIARYKVICRDDPSTLSRNGRIVVLLDLKNPKNERASKTIVSRRNAISQVVLQCQEIDRFYLRCTMMRLMPLSSQAVGISIAFRQQQQQQSAWHAPQSKCNQHNTK